MKKQLSLFLTLLSILITYCSCNNKMDQFQEKLVEDGYFWQTSNPYEFLFKKDGSVKILKSENGNSSTIGNWSYDKSKHKLIVAWKDIPQFEAEIVEIEPNWDYVKVNGCIYSNSNWTLTRMKLLDKRFD